MSRQYITLFDTTLRDGQQTQGVDFSLEDKIRIARALDDLGIDYIEGGWPGANPTDSDFFDSKLRFKTARLTAFGMTKRIGRSVENDHVLAAVMRAHTPSVCLVGKTHDFHVKTALGITLKENHHNIVQSIKHIVAQGREALFDCEHFFDGYRQNSCYALNMAKAAYDAGSRWIVLCDTNGGSLPTDIYRVTRAVIDAGVPGDHIGIHAHNDSELAIANTLAAVDAGAQHIQGTLNGLGERCGNANLISLIPTLLLKQPYVDRYKIGVSHTNLLKLTKLSRMLDDILNRVPYKQAAYVGASAFAHKSGLHASAILKNPTTYEHIAPEMVGNERVIPISNQAGRSNLRERLRKARLSISNNDPRLLIILREIKRLEACGYAYDCAQASFELIARRVLGKIPTYFTVQRYRVNVECRRNSQGKMKTISEAVVAVKIANRVVLSASESSDESSVDSGPVSALSRALSKDLGPYQKWIDDMRLVDFKVRIMNAGVEAVTRVIINSEDGKGRHWSTVGVSANILDASFKALLDAIYWKLINDDVKLAY